MNKFKINELLETLIDELSKEKNLRPVCEKYIETLHKFYSNPNTIKSKYTIFRNAIKDKLGKNHESLEYFTLSEKEREKGKEDNLSKKTLRLIKKLNQVENCKDCTTDEHYQVDKRDEKKLPYREVKAFSEEFITELRKTTSSINTLANRVTSVRNRIKKSLGENHYSLKFIRLSEKEYEERFQKQLKKTQTRQENPSHLNAENAISKAIELIKKENNYSAMTAGILLLTGRRPSEIVYMSSFEKIDHNTLKANNLAKKKDDVEEHEIKVLHESDEILAAIKKIRNLTSKETYKQNLNTINNFVKKAYGGIVPGKENEKLPTCKALRSAYSLIIAKKKQEEGSLKLEDLEQQKALSHESKSITENYRFMKILHEISFQLSFESYKKWEKIKTSIGTKRNSLIKREVEKLIDTIYQEINGERKASNKTKALLEIKKTIIENKNEKYFFNRKEITSSLLHKKTGVTHYPTLDEAIEILKEEIKEHHKTYEITQEIKEENEDIFIRSLKKITNLLKEGTLEEEINNDFLLAKTELRTEEDVKIFYEKYPNLHAKIIDHNLKF